ncbi:hypothetical protein [Catelliglobosispora koreensis]|uniref:hypothetical protein n=1 Tax=Catelliglobosispora koreensis TaxID=129052 RepID=UPI0003765F1C|nr:hypothetical protein [Catelliglobosispora koreensis]
MAALNLIEIVNHGRDELTTAVDTVLLHQRETSGDMCRCMRVWPCPVNLQAAAYVRYWESRLADLEAQLANVTRA